MRVIVTGSRDWPWTQVVWNDLYDLAQKAEENEEHFRLYFGDCQTGADDAADCWLENNGSLVTSSKIFFADWKLNDRAAGPIRNSEMVNFVKDMDLDDEVICLAYRLNGSRGTTDCMNKAAAAGFEVRVWDLARRVHKSL